ASGGRVVDREDEARGLARLRTVAVGRGDDLRPVAAGEVVAQGTRVEVRRAGLVERFENSERGLEQTWIVASRPAGDGPLEVEVTTGAKVAHVQQDRAE